MHVLKSTWLFIWIMAPRSSIHNGSHGSTPGLPSRKSKKASVLCNIVECRCNASKQTTFKCEYLIQHFSVAWEEKVISLFVLLQLSQEQRKEPLPNSFLFHPSMIIADIYVQVHLSSLMLSYVKQQYPQKTLLRDCIPPLSQACHFPSEGATRSREIYEVFV